MIPMLQALWLAESADLDPVTGRVTLTGLFDQVRAPAGADDVSGGVVYFSVRGVHGEARLTLRYVDLADNEPLIERPVRVEGEPLDTTDVSVRVNRIPVPHPGGYVWELYAGGELLGTVRVTATAEED